MRINEGSQDLNRWLSSAWAKNALASFNISLALRSSRTSRSSALPALVQRSSSHRACRSRPRACAPIRSMSVAHPQSWGQSTQIAAHMEEYSPRCSSTMRTARSRTSGENLFDFFMAPFSQMLEPPQNPGRFKLCNFRCSITQELHRNYTYI